MASADGHARHHWARTLDGIQPSLWDGKRRLAKRLLDERAYTYTGRIQLRLMRACAIV